jgi:8-oxo-dGTP pyrophosphatase MutT (NUDIX family)
LKTLLDLVVNKSSEISAMDLSRFQAPTNKEFRQSAVLLLFGHSDDGPDLTFIQRSSSVRNHPGQVGFPGGMQEPEDENEIATALREASEEIALNPESVEVITVLPKLFVPVSQFEVTPVVAHWHTPHEVYPNDISEIARVERIPVAELADPSNRMSVRHSSGFVGPAFDVRNFVIWGFTGGLLDSLLSIYELDQEWDAEKVVDLDPRYS